MLQIHCISYDVAATKCYIVGVVGGIALYLYSGLCLFLNCICIFVKAGKIFSQEIGGFEQQAVAALYFVLPCSSYIVAPAAKFYKILLFQRSGEWQAQATGCCMMVALQLGRC